MKLTLNVQEPAAVPASPTVSTAFSDKIPSNWEIVADGDKIRARNNVSLELFEGTMAEFNSRLRG